MYQLDKLLKGQIKQNMDYIRVIGIFLVLALITSCNNKEKTVIHNADTKIIEVNKEVTTPGIEAFIKKNGRQGAF